MVTAFALLYWPVAGCLLLLLYPNKREPDHAWQQNLALGVWLVVSLGITHLIADNLHPTNTALRVLCSPHGSRDLFLHLVMMLSALIPFLVWRFSIRNQRKQQQP
jgi:hypothetical protein